METKEKTSKKILIKIADKLTEAQQEVDELAVQLALGKAEAKNKFEEVKRDFKIRISEFRQYIASSSARDELSDIRSKLDDLEKNLEKGEAATAEAFALQKEKLIEAVTAVENSLSKKMSALADLNLFTNEIEKFKLKLEILRLKFELRKLNIEDEFKTRMTHARSYIESIRNLANEKIAGGKERVEDFRDEIRQAYKHFRKAFSEL